MVKSSVGLLILDNKEYTLYEIETPRAYRLDIMEKGGEFQIDTHLLIASKYQAKDYWVYGDLQILDKVQSFLKEVRTCNIPAIDKSEWVAGYFIQTFEKHSERIYHLSQLKNGELEEETLILDKTVCKFQRIKVWGEDMVRPMNLKSYTKQELSKKSLSSENVEYYSINTLKRRHPINHILNRDDIVVKSLSDFQPQTFNEGLMGIDSETTGLDFNLEGKSELSTIILSGKDNQTYLFPFKSTKFEHLDYDRDAFNLCEQLRELQDETIRKNKGNMSGFVAHLKRFDSKVFFKVYQDHLDKVGYEETGVNPFDPTMKTYKSFTDYLNIKHCSQNLAAVYNSDFMQGSRELKDLAYEATGNYFLNLTDVFLDKEGVTKFHILDEDVAKAYGGPDGDNPRIVFKYLWNKLAREVRPIYEIEAACAQIKAKQEYFGVRISEEELVKQYNTISEKNDFLERLIYNMIQEKINLSSQQAMSYLLYDKMHCEVLAWTKENKPSTSKKTLQNLASKKLKTPRNILKQDIFYPNGDILAKAKDLNEKAYPVITLILEYKIYNKLLTGFFNKLMSLGK